MHPALSIIIFTVLSGLGYGLAAILGLGVLDAAALPTKIAHVVALALITAGLLASTLHLGNPQRAWRAFSQWRTSWLSREGVMAVATFLPLLCSAYACIIDDRYLAIPGLIGTAGCIVTVYCTSMIYACLRSVQSWNTPLTSLCFGLTSLAGGLLLASVAAASAGSSNLFWIGLAAVVVLAAAFAAKIVWRRRAEERPSLSTPESATGLGFTGRVRLLERPHTTDNYLTREMGFKVARKHAAKLWRFSALAAYLGPIILVLGGMVAYATLPAMSVTLMALAALTHLVGNLVDRWLFFAQARHAVTAYYDGTRRASVPKAA
jgi:DMSO reductase anchor subunit